MYQNLYTIYISSQKYYNLNKNKQFPHNHIKVWLCKKKKTYISILKQVAERSKMLSCIKVLSLLLLLAAFCLSNYILIQWYVIQCFVSVTFTAVSCYLKSCFEGGVVDQFTDVLR